MVVFKLCFLFAKKSLTDLRRWDPRVETPAVFDVDTDDTMEGGADASSQS